jgi:hypothetical protein
MISAADVNLLGKNMNTMKKDTESLLHASREVGPEVVIESYMYVYIS